MESAYGVGKPPPELKLAWQCERWGALPDKGAYLDQDYVLMSRMTALSNINNTLQRWKNAEGRSVHSLSDGDRRILKWLKDEGLMFNG